MNKLSPMKLLVSNGQSDSSDVRSDDNKYDLIINSVKFSVSEHPNGPEIIAEVEYPIEI
jgi:hypothetical protein